MIVEQPRDEFNAKSTTELTPRRKSTRICVENTKQKISIITEDMSPEYEKRQTRKSMVKHSSPPSTPKRPTSKRVAGLQIQRATPQTPKTERTPKTPKSQGVMYVSVQKFEFDSEF